MLSAEKIYEILLDWNFWGKEFKTVIPRDSYRNRLSVFRVPNKIIALSGIRRCGKTSLFYEEMADLAKDPKNILYINFEDDRFGAERSPELIRSALEAYRQHVNPEGECYLFLDEVQTVEGWERWARTAYDLAQVNRIYVTGSSSQLLSGDFASSISGRYLGIDVFPLTFREFLLFNGLNIGSPASILNAKVRILELLDAYLKWGGFPEAALEENDMRRKELLSSYLDTIIYKDIVARHEIRNVKKIKNVVRYFLSNDTLKTNVNSASKSLRINYRTVGDYISYMKEAYLIEELNRYDYSLKKQLASDCKYYCTDAGLVNLAAFSFSEQKGRLLENAVFNHLHRSGESLFFFSGKNECDFLVMKGNKVGTAVQACWEIDGKNREREVGGLLEAMKEFGLQEGFIITYGQEESFSAGGKNIFVIPLWKWLLQ
ncbi:ATP-binding protein [Candidatus Micrarchaeota archaeon]|nr:ATP-binding protein [Candidatus Micrarchaeota archaeon]